MSAAHDYEDLHHLVDQLTPAQARALRAVALQLVEPHPHDTAEDQPDAGRRRRLSFAGIMAAEHDLAERSEEILRTELGRNSA